MEGNIKSTSPQNEAPTPPELEVVQGENQGEVFKVKADTRIGREQDNDVIILDSKVSRYHAKISLEEEQWMLTDLDSANGTLVNGRAITGPVALQSGDQISFGETEIVFKSATRPDAVTAPNKVVSTPQSAGAPMPGASAPPRQERKLPVAWIAAGLIVLVCFAALFVIYLAVNRLDEGTTSVAGATAVPLSETDTNTQANDQSSPSEPSADNLVLAYEDDFSDSFGGWDDAFDTYTRKVYGNNRYQIEVNASNLVAWGLANRDVADFEMEVEAKLEDGDVKNSYGIIFRFQDRNNFYRFDISGDGFYLFSKFIDGEWSTLIDWTPSESINPGNSANILKVSAFGPDITLSVNGRELASVTDESLTHGNFGFFAGTFAEPFAWVSFDNLKLWTPPSGELTLIPTATRPGAVAAAAEAATQTEGQTSTETVVETAPTTPTPPQPTGTPTATVEATGEEEDAAEEDAAEEVSPDSPVSTPTATPSPTLEATVTPVPLPEYASRDQTLARGEEEAVGRIVFPVFDAERGTYDIYMADVADGDNRELIQSNASQPALTDDGTEIAYRSWQPDQRGLFARSLGADELDAWGFDLFFEAARPQFSPTDKSLIYHSRTGGREPATYRVIDGVGSVMRREGFPIQGKSPKWSPDGQQFVYSSCLGSNCGIVVSSIDGGAPQLLTDHPSDTNPEISPDGSTVVFMSERGGNWEIYRVDIDGGNVMALTSDRASDGLPTWSPDGDKIAFVSNRDGDWALWDMNPDGSNKRRHFLLGSSIDGIVRHDPANSFGWVEENIDWIP